MATSTPLQTNAVIPPGELLREELEARGMTQKQLAQTIGRPAQLISEICRGKKEITAETALDLEKALGTPAYMWIALEGDYRLALARKRRQSAAG
ncbi:MAG: HigA family addiction module antidote protein [Chloroflexi bacterium]|nr:HigA family addiction module antidote protein [Chloroflexota bacterium]